MAQTANLHRLGVFREATSMSVSPDGRVFVVDAGERSLLEFRADGRRRVVLTPGDGPRFVDASEGLRLVVTHESSESVDLLSAEGGLILRLPVPADPAGAFLADPGFLASSPVSDRSGGGVPGTVVRLKSGALVAYERLSRSLLFWDQAGRPVRVVRGPHDEDLNVVGMAAWGQGLILADDAHPGIRVLDQFGTWQDTMATELEGISSVAAGISVWVEAGGRVFEIAPSGAAQSSWTTGLLDTPIALALMDGDGTEWVNQFKSAQPAADRGVQTAGAEVPTLQAGSSVKRLLILTSTALYLAVLPSQ